MVVPVPQSRDSCVFRLSAGCSAFELRDEFKLRFQTELSHVTKNDAGLGRWPDANEMIRFIALAKEQLALIADEGPDGISFR